MDIYELYAQALNLHKEKKYDEALKILDEIKILAPNYKKTYMLESFIWQALHEPLKEAAALETVLLKYDLSSPDEKDFAVHVLRRLGKIALHTGLRKQGVRSYWLATKLLEKTSRSNFEGELSNIITMANTAENFSAEDFRALYADYENCLADIKPYPKKFYNHKKIRVGFLSDYFYRGHVVIAWSWSLLTELDKKFFETYFYSNRKNFDNVTEKLRASADGWRDIFDLTDEQAAKIIREDEIDILFNLDGHTSRNQFRVAAYHPATVQISGIGHVNSTGLSCFDYFLSDEICAGDENFFTEKVLKLPHSHICFRPTKEIEPAKNPPCLKNNFVTFGSFNQYNKINDSILRAWKKILDAVPNSRLILKHHDFFGTEEDRIFIDKRLKSFDFDPARIELRGVTSTYLAEYADVDIALDTFPYTGGVTTCEALYMGVPVVSLYGQRHGTRFGLSILKNVGLAELAVDSYDEYINRAVMLAGDWELLTILRKNLRVMMKKSPLMNSENYLREIQAAFKKILSD